MGGSAAAAGRGAPTMAAPPPWLVLLLASLLGASAGGQLGTGGVHKTPGAAKVVNDLWCHRCHTMDPSNNCAEIKNHTFYAHKCKDEKKLCMVKRYSYTTSNENSTSELRMWALERNCTKHCQPGCIVIGERTKLYSCTSCCDTTLCNSGTGVATPTRRRPSAATLAALLLALVAATRASS